MHLVATMQSTLKSGAEQGYPDEKHHEVGKYKYRKYKSHFQSIPATRHQFLTRAGGHWEVLEKRWSRDWGPKARLWTGH